MIRNRRHCVSSGRPLKADAEGRRLLSAILTLTICYLMQPGKTSYGLCKKKGKAVVSVILFWSVGFAALGWLVFKIAQLM
jgi:hypothetical protein